MDINFSAPINFLGYGVVGFNLYKALCEDNNTVALWPLPHTQAVQAEGTNHELLSKGIDNQKKYNKNAPSIRHWHQFDLAQHVGKGLHVGSTVFELNKFMDTELHNLSQQDLIAVPTKWAQDILIENNIQIPSFVLPHGVDRTIFNENIDGLDEFKSDATTFLNVSKWEIRKGHDIIVDAFNKAFEPKDNVRLIMACHNPFFNDSENDEWSNLYLNSRLGELNKVMVSRRRFDSQREVAALMKSVDCGIFPSRAEGWGLDAFEMMSIGKPVIMTNYSGHTGYANENNAMLVSIDEMETAYDGKWFFGQGEWAALGDSQIDQIVEYMRLVHRQKQDGQLKLNQAGIETAKTLSWKNAAKILVDNIK